MSAAPSSLKSATATMLNGAPTSATLSSSPITVARPIMWPPDIYHTCASLVRLLCHRMSSRPSRLKSPVPTMLHGGPTNSVAACSSSTVALLDTRRSFISQSCVSLVELLCHRTFALMIFSFQVNKENVRWGLSRRSDDVGIVPTFVQLPATERRLNASRNPVRSNVYLASRARIART